MSLRINTNIPSLSAQRSLGQTSIKLDSSLKKLASGLRIIKSGDDPAGLAISEKLRGDIRSLRQAKRNANDGIAFIQVGEGGLVEIVNMLIRLRELAMQAGSDTLGNDERKLSNVEFQNLKQEIDRIAKTTEFNGVNLLDGSNNRFEFQVGLHNNPELDRVVYDARRTDARIDALDIDGENILSKENAHHVLDKVDDAIVLVNGMRAGLGALQSRLVSTVNNLAIVDENFSDAKSRISDVDVASESSELARNTILQRAGVSVLSQANMIPQTALTLITGQ